MKTRTETVHDTPLFVVAMSDDLLHDRGVDDIEDVAANVAGFSVQNLGPGQSQVAMRGISAGQIVRDQPGVKEQVGVYLDESVVSLSLFTPDIDLFDVSRVEVLRGPQGTLFGSGSLSGTVGTSRTSPSWASSVCSASSPGGPSSRAARLAVPSSARTSPWARRGRCGSRGTTTSWPATSTPSSPT
jgi:iron complex outermembrane receptor protein